MKKINLTNIDIEVFERVFLNFKRFVTSDFEFNFDNSELTTKSNEFNKWHLVTLGQMYGGNIFRKKNELEILSTQAVSTKFLIEYNVPKILIETDWKDNFEFNPAYLNSADFFLTKKLVDTLSINSKQVLKNTIPDFDFEQRLYNNDYRYAYFIANKTLTFIKTEGRNAEINNLFKIRWNGI